MAETKTKATSASVANYLASRGSDEAPLSGFAIRGRDIIIYLLAESVEQEQLLQQPGRHSS
ncbi:hypothetical protein [Rheinheimera sp. NSM]|uniref:hypothetical protein n=1 Tax=Rheinheimera sp. NSM TaxID=3457884 RepID=UPI0040361794